VEARHQDRQGLVVDRPQSGDDRGGSGIEKGPAPAHQIVAFREVAPAGVAAGEHHEAGTGQVEAEDLEELQVSVILLIVLLVAAACQAQSLLKELCRGAKAALPGKHRGQVVEAERQEIVLSNPSRDRESRLQAALRVDQQNFSWRLRLRDGPGR
jgi:hypothetical protein